MAREQAHERFHAPHIVIDEKAQKDEDIAPSSAHTLSPTSSHSALSPPTSPPASPPAMTSRHGHAAEDYYSSRGRTDRLGNPIHDRHRRPSAMASVYNNARVTLPGDLGPNDPRRPRSPAPAPLPGDLGPNDPRRPPSENNSPISHVRHTSLEDAEGGVRLMKDPKEPAPIPDEPHHESDEDADADNDNDTDLDDTKRGRGRKRPEPGRTTSGKAVNLRSESVDSDADWRARLKPDPTKGESMLTFRTPDPSIKITPATTSPTTTSTPKKRVHPSTAFDASTPLEGSDAESQSDLLAAQKLSLSMSAIHSTPSAHRVIRQILRGDYAHFQRLAEEGQKRQRMYLVATDLSSESEYALEWTIGTVLRDGDTLFAVYAVDEEQASTDGAVEIGHGAESVRDTAAIVRGLPTWNPPQQQAPASPGPSPLGDRSASRNPNSSTPAEQERRRLAESITARCISLLRKTTLQIRCVVEVFHCKSPRHMICEVIDFLTPTLVVIGSRGRSNVKGVLLGSFSNYLVTKSSVPVMVARKKLRRHAKAEKGGDGAGVRRNKDGTAVPYSGSGRSGRLSNVIEAPRGKGLRVKGWGEVGID